MTLPYVEVWRLDLDTHTETWVATFKNRNAAFHYGEEKIKSATVAYILKEKDTW